MTSPRKPVKIEKPTEAHEKRIAAEKAEAEAKAKKEREQKEKEEKEPVLLLNDDDAHSTY